MQKIVRRAALEAAALPPAQEACFDLMKEAGEGVPFALFGGALRDARYNHMYPDQPDSVKINDCDMRMIAPGARVEELVRRLGSLARKTVRAASSAGTGLPLYRIDDYYGANLDISFRSSLPELDKGILIDTTDIDDFSDSTRIAQERAANAVLGISGIAMDSEGGVWETPWHLADCEQRTLTVFPRDMYPRPTESRVSEYLAHMQAKFPGHRVVVL